MLSHPEKPGRANPSAFLCNTSNDHGILSRHDLGPCGNTQKAVEAVLDLERFSSKHHATVVSYRSFAKKRQFTASAVIFVHVHVRLLCRRRHPACPQSRPVQRLLQHRGHKGLHSRRVGDGPGHLLGFAEGDVYFPYGCIYSELLLFVLSSPSKSKLMSIRLLAPSVSSVSRVVILMSIHLIHPISRSASISTSCDSDQSVFSARSNAKPPQMPRTARQNAVAQPRRLLPLLLQQLRGRQRPQPSVRRRRMLKSRMGEGFNFDVMNNLSIRQRTKPPDMYLVMSISGPP